MLMKQKLTPSIIKCGKRADKIFFLTSQLCYQYLKITTKKKRKKRMFVVRFISYERQPKCQDIKRSSVLHTGKDSIILFLFYFKIKSGLNLHL